MFCGWNIYLQIIQKKVLLTQFLKHRNGNISTDLIRKYLTEKDFHLKLFAVEINSKPTPLWINIVTIYFITFFNIWILLLAMSSITSGLREDTNRSDNCRQFRFLNINIYIRFDTDVFNSNELYNNKKNPTTQQINKIKKIISWVIPGVHIKPLINI